MVGPSEQKFLMYFTYYLPYLWCGVYVNKDTSGLPSLWSLLSTLVVQSVLE